MVLRTPLRNILDRCMKIIVHFLEMALSQVTSVFLTLEMQIFWPVLEAQKPKKLNETDNIPFYICKGCVDFVVTPLSHLVNLTSMILGGNS